MNKFDLHIHSIASGHAFSTIEEIINHSRKIRMDAVAITDHGPSMKGASHLEFFSMFGRLPRQIGNMQILYGCETNIIDTEGNLDLPEKYLENLDVIIAGLHKLTPFPDGSDENMNTRAIVNAIEKNRIDILAHPWRSDFPVDLKKIVNAAKKKDVILEINCSLLRLKKRDLIVDKIKQMISLAEKNELKVVVSSDAHFSEEIGNFDLLNDCGIKISKRCLLDKKDISLKLIRRTA